MIVEPAALRAAAGMARTAADSVGAARPVTPEAVPTGMPDSAMARICYAANQAAAAAGTAAERDIRNWAANVDESAVGYEITDTQNREAIGLAGGGR